MSTNKTTNYNLHAWEAGDDFLRSEFNENFTKLDGAVYDLLATGTYTGDGATSRTIELGFTPRAVLLFNSYGATISGYNYGGLALPGYGCNAVSIVEGGFQVKDQSHDQSNLKNSTYYYLVLR